MPRELRKVLIAPSVSLPESADIIEVHTGYLIVLGDWTQPKEFRYFQCVELNEQGPLIYKKYLGKSFYDYVFEVYR